MVRIKFKITKETVIEKMIKKSIIKILCSFIMLVCVSAPTFSIEIQDEVFFEITDKELYTSLKEMETYYYGHDYNEQATLNRLDRLEKTLFKYNRSNLTWKQRFTDLNKLFQTKKSPFYIHNKREKQLPLSQMSLLSLMENRLFGSMKKDMPLEKRINDLEMAILGTSTPGTLKERFDYISERTPIKIKGVRISSKGQTIASYVPDHKPVPVPKSVYHKVYSPLSIEYDNLHGDFFSFIARNSSDEVLRWNDFPVYVFINSNDPDEINLTRLAIEYWQDKVPLRETSNYETANVLVDWASQGTYVTVPIIANNKGAKQIKVIINMLEPKRTEPKENMLVFLMHQMGHSLGIWGHSDNPKDIMYPIGKLGTRDINTKKKTDFFYEPIILESRKPNITKRDLNTLFRVYQNSTSIDKILAIW